MIIENVFDYKIARIICEDKSIFQNVDLARCVNDILTSEPVIGRIRGKKGDSHVGPGYTTVSQPYLDLIYLPGASRITQWVTEQFLLARDIISPSLQGNNVVFNRSWVNQFDKNAHGKCHTHIRETIDGINKPDFVGIFYVEVPENSSPLIFVNNGIADVEHTEFPEQDKYYVHPKQGEFVIHPANAWHAIGLHQSDLRRLCFVFDIDIE
jgi:hypothetical protein